MDPLVQAEVGGDGGRGGAERGDAEHPEEGHDAVRRRLPHSRSHRHPSARPLPCSFPFGAAERGKERDVGDGAAEAGGDRGGGTAGPYGTSSSRALSRGGSNGGGGRRRAQDEAI